LLTDEEISLAAIQLSRIERKYDDVQVHSHSKRLYAFRRFQKTATRHLPKLSQSETVLSRASAGADCREQRRSEQIAMFYITAETCRTFTLAEVLITAAMNVDTTRPVPQNIASVKG
jgi:hypothetical protein